MHYGNLGFLCDVGSHAQQFLHVHEAVFKNLLGNHGSSTCLGHQGHELGLQISRESRVWGGVNVDSTPISAWFDPHPVRAGFDLKSTLAHFYYQGLNVSGNTLLYPDVAPRDCPGNQQGSRFNPIRYDSVFTGM